MFRRGDLTLKRIALLALALALALAACGKNPAPDDPGAISANTPDAPSASETAAIAEEIDLPPASAELSSQWNSFQFELEGAIYTLPMRWTELEANGWAAGNSRDMDEILEPGKYILNYMTMVYSNKENSEIYVQFANLGDEDMPLGDCYVSGIQFAGYSWNKNTSIYFPGGLTVGSTRAEVEALYGQPSETQGASSALEWKYQTQIYEDVIINFNSDTEKIEKMRMSNIYLP
jgi:hypothetical protein